MSLGKNALLVRAFVALFAVIAVAMASAAPSEAATKLPRWKTSNGYQCHKHSKRVINRHKGRVWPARGTKSRTHCVKIRPKRHRSRGGSSAWVLPRYVVLCESGGNPRAVNYSNPLRPAGLYQIITPTWLGYGGGRFASTADRASVYEQGVIAKRVLAGQGPRAWECW